ncbi:unnamed protein product [Gemmataceae bacterium]|nr:unnamed protein product [Gemmataceae bacterium]VTT96561.1 unnamed protein product [Gemmataceae bacterium]
MSARALLRAVEARLRSAAVLNDQPAQPVGRVCAARDDGRPPQNMGQWFYSVHHARAEAGTDGDVVDVVDLYHAVTVTITARKAYAPDDRKGQVLVTAGDVIDRAEALAAPGVVHGNYVDVMNAANALIPGTAEYDAIHGGGVTTNGFVEPLWLLGYGPCEEKPASWVGSRDAAEVLAIAVRFGKARRLQV